MEGKIVLCEEIKGTKNGKRPKSAIIDVISLGRVR